MSSAGGSGGRDLTEATNPPAAGAALNGLTPASFDGVNDRIGGAGTSTFLATTAGTVICLFKANAASADAGSVQPYLIPALLTNQNGFYCLGYSTSGVRFGGYNGTNYDSVAVAANTGNWHVCVARHNTTTISLSVDLGTAQTQSRNLASSIDASAIQVGANYLEAQFFNGLIAELICFNSELTDAQVRDIIRTYLNPRYGLTF